MGETRRLELDAPRALLPDRPFGRGERWHVVHVKSRQEMALSTDLDDLRIQHYLPCREDVRYHGRRKARVILPVFRGYLFLWGNRDQAFEADRTRRVANLISVVDQELLEWELENLERALASGMPLTAPAGLLQGHRGAREPGGRPGPRGSAGVDAGRRREPRDRGSASPPGRTELIGGRSRAG